ncbi:MAG: type II secretion system F family protein, partial [Lacunisphaera sp.]|nr:type II secretion system F family protein [Lacunisphaera sp.]
MPRFAYTALDARGTEKTGLLGASDIKQAATILKGQGLFPTDVAAARPDERAGLAFRSCWEKSARKKEPASESAAWARGPKSALRLPFTRPVSPKELSVFTRQLATLLKAGMPLLRGLEVLGRQERNAGLHGVIEAMTEAIKSGGSLSEAMAQHPKVFGQLYLNMIKAGEAGGVIGVALERLASFQEKSLQLRGKIAAAMVYPVIVMAVAMLILVGLLVFVVPKFQQIFADLLKGAPLPALTQAVLSVS